MGNGPTDLATDGNHGELTMLRIGHRGAAGHERENTMRSFRRALDIGVDLIETDLRLTADGALVLSHDPRMDVAGAQREVRAATLAELRAASSGSGEGVATLDDLLSVAAGRSGLMLELKVEGIAGPTVEAVEAASFPGSLIYASFHHGELLTIRRLRPEAKTLALIHAGPVDKVQFALDARATHAGINIEFATAEFVDALHKAGLAVFVYTVDEPGEIAAMKALRVDGIISDYPDRV
jgi:glycerophosphoryl diester phosphodiesterase